jgi:HSP20 family molecular chaperone IbpA
LGSQSKASIRATSLQYNQAVAQRPSRPPLLHVLDDFERMFDSLFDDLLISRWRGTGPLSASGDIQLIDRDDRYEVTMRCPGIDPGQLDIEVSDRRLIVRSLDPNAQRERVIDFKQPIDAEAVTAELSEDELRITLPKRPARKIAVS